MKCKECGNTEYTYNLTIWAEFKICLGDVEFVRDRGKSEPEGPFTCTHCGSMYHELEEGYRQTDLDRELIDQRKERLI